MVQIADLAVSLIAVALAACPVLYSVDYYTKRLVGRYIAPIATLITIPLTAIAVIFRKTLTLPLVVEPYSMTLSAIAGMGAFLALWAALRTCGRAALHALYYLVPVNLLGVYLTAMSRDIALFLVSWFMISVSSTAVLALGKDRFSVEGAVKYAVLGMVVTSVLVFSIAAFTATSKTLLWSDISAAPVDGGLMATALGATLLLVALSFKLGAFPFHWWLPDAYGKVTPILVAALAGCAELMPVVALTRFLSPLSASFPAMWVAIISLISIFSMTYGNVIALIQKNFQRMMAYAVIADVGYLLIGLAPYAGFSKVLGLEGILIEALAVALATVAIFTFAHYVRDKVGSLSLASLKALGRSMPASSLAVAIALFSLLGVPPLVGFWGKLYLFASVLTVAPWLAVAGVINSGVSAGYYAIVLKQLYFAAPGGKRTEKLERLSDPEVVTMLLCAVLSTALGLGVAPYLATAVTLA